MSKVILRSINEVSEQLGLAAVTLRLWIAQGRVGYVRLGRRAIRIPETEVQRIIDAGTVPSRWKQ